MVQEEEAEAEAEEERPGPGLTMFTDVTDGSRLDSGAAGYGVTCQNGRALGGIKTHMGYSQEAYELKDDRFCSPVSEQDPD